ncbi:fused MFS/spermidine synthase [Phenylobacterium deserti]|uniref:Spermidine synthase n=1 Tax=Phenylobacterium deserti TaxID=1914756 RepID=A0A328AJE1_9CAUL|nr:fused MFS/spermidine synthase [Phenylobacterium deserti]RAK52978.1 spermidine synthase [Phenylobacterium deserti]
MTTIPADRRPAPPPAALFAITVFASAALVFLVQPMIAKLLLPLQGGSPQVWNTSLAFFQAALLAGYGYAHLLQRLKTVRAQALTHVGALLIAAVALPLRVNALFGPPSSDHPILWLLGVLAVSLGAPFAILSATAPLVQAWWARTRGQTDGREPYALYAASNLGSLLALLAYPLVVEPVFPVSGQRLGWSAAYVAFVGLMAVLALAAGRSAGPAAPAAKAPHARASWRERLTWLALAAAPSSLMLGVTTYITTDIASAPFLWVIPLALYLVTFIIAFQTRPLMSPGLALFLHALLAAECAAMMPFMELPIALQLLVNLGAFFFSALVCHQALVARRPDPSRLTEFYLWMSVGGVVGGGFNAFVAPVIFNNVWEYPLVLALACLARPWGGWNLPARAWVLLVVGVLCAMAAPVVVTFRHHFGAQHGDTQLAQVMIVALISASVICAVLLRRWALMFFAAVAVLAIGAHGAAERSTNTRNWRSFFGVLTQSEVNAPSMGGAVRMLSHGTTLHGAQATNPQFACRPLVYYTPGTPIGQVVLTQGETRPAMRMGVVGLGTGSMAAYAAAPDHLTFFEIDPLVVRIASDPAHFSYTTRCARGRVDYVIGDARLTLARQPAESFDVLLIDAFSSDAVPAHLLTVEAIRGYLGKLKPDGVLILHLSNRNLELKAPAFASARAAGGFALLQQRRVFGNLSTWESDEDALVVGRTPQAIARYAADTRWIDSAGRTVRPWTDDYTNVPGSFWSKMKERMGGLR